MAIVPLIMGVRQRKHETNVVVVIKWMEENAVMDDAKGSIAMSDEFESPGPEVL